ncbi:MAG: hypothetical protein OXG61_02965 [Chloroflexi bacterium]|nr:hypothetical protein [Chloroflexota bacterium]
MARRSPNRGEGYGRAQERLEALLASLLEADQQHSWRALRRLDERYADLCIAIRSVARWEGERERLIELHCMVEPTHSPVHDEYHQVTEELLVAVSSGFAQIKTFLNTLAVFINRSLPQSDTRGLRFKGWGALVKSAVKTSDSPGPLGNLRRLLAERGSDYETRFLDYRDKHLEHPGDLTGRSLRHGPTKIIHTKEPAFQRRRGTPSGAPPYLIDEACLELSGGGRVHYFHVASPTAGGHLDKGVLGSVHDSSGAHFAAWESHYHAFATPDAPADITRAILSASRDFTISKESPAILDAMGELMQMTEEVVRVVAESRLSS